MCTNVPKSLEEEKTIVLSQFSDKHDFVNFPSIKAKQFMEQPFILPRPDEKFFNIIGYVTQGFTGTLQILDL